MTNWEYALVSFSMASFSKEKKHKEIQESLNEWGAKGWEVAGVGMESNLMIYTLKRPVSPQS